MPSRRRTETAAAIANLDLVVAADTAIVHLAGALGRPVWVLVRSRSDWRWLLGREDSPWYPSMRIFRQPKPGDWDSVVAAVAAELGVRSTALSARISPRP
jgi:ADP-heptose:LPS heptosyltransferase